jgi:hypothetical protein
MLGWLLARLASALVLGGHCASSLGSTDIDRSTVPALQGIMRATRPQGTVLSPGKKRNGPQALSPWEPSGAGHSSKGDMNKNGALRSVVGLIVVASISSGCASQASSGPGNTPPKDDPQVEGLVLRVDTGGGMLPPSQALTQIPQFSLYSDGQILTQGVQIEIYPGPALPPVFSTQVNDDGLRRIIEAARRAGLDGPDRHYDLPTVADAATTTFSFIEDGRRHVISAYALGMEAPDQSIPESERKARAALLELENRLGNLRGWLPTDALSRDQPFDYRALAVFVVPKPEGEQIPEPEMSWPLDRSIAEFTQQARAGSDVTCFAVAEQDLEKLRPLVARANQLTPWRSESKTYWLRFRPLLPDESGCPQA